EVRAADLERIAAEGVGDLLDHLHDQGINPPLIVGEFFDANTGLLKGWVDGVLANMDEDTKQTITVKVFDFALRDALKNASDAFGYDVRNVFNSGLVDGGSGATGFQSVTFLNNHDFREPGTGIQNDPMLGYAYLLTNNQVGLPSVFYPDYFGIPIPSGPTVNLSAPINELIRIQKDYIVGSSSVDYLSRFNTPYSQSFTSGFPNTTLLYQLQNTPTGHDVIVAINYAGEALVLEQGVNTNSAGLANGQMLVELTNNSGSPNPVVANGRLQLQVPARSYAVWVADEAVSTQGETWTNEKLVKVAPNPAKEKIQLYDGGWKSGDATVECIDISGKVAWSTNQAIVASTPIELNVSALVPGTYLVQIRQGAAVVGSVKLV
ncbi:MAG: T9SS type A sorting domain-containing protein, partial [Bacteroidota bacterium]